ncbi:multicopper oxidase family protein [Thermoflavimicrobium dichotomicum]|uniref:Copper-containing nitrite reductase n=1 Tax=Thermoflavimicrobium dichotomicum TaxID=46223 RepID=A0A1I3RXM8_9BACL|nr:multicopper oxidase family protein [Thermoflavimicrobium dichotomicum]SFJ51088.1 Multicopper oxidase with three cupredoxin domains (includes cell division protein FtsP and spore coat protein CotA) [Thermoflavimicrobium dichotomicum]
MKKWKRMMKNSAWLLISTLAIAGCSATNTSPGEHTQHMGQVEENMLKTPKVMKDKDGKTVKEFTVTAKETKWQISDGLQVNALTYDGSVPGKTIQVEQGDKVRVHLKNQLKKPVSIHWHGYPVPNTMDGVPGMTQDPVEPGKSFTYEFEATVPGTFWYHSHFDSSNQVDQGLYGAFVVLPKQEDEKFDREYTLILDEWQGKGNQTMDHSQMNHSQMDHSQMNTSKNHSEMNMNNHSSSSQNHSESHNKMPNMDHDEMMKQMYNVYSVNGKSGSLVQPLKVKKGEKVRLRIINAGYLTHDMHLQDQSFRVLSTDGNAIKNAKTVKDQLVSIGAGERYDLGFVAGNKSFAIDFHEKTAGAKSLVIPVQVEGSTSSKQQADHHPLPVLNMANYVAEKEKTASFDSSYTLRLNSTIQNGEQVYTINGKTWPNTDPIPVKKGEKVKVTLINEGKSDHPMHLHGHFFDVLAKNGKPVTGQIKKDTLVLKPGEKYEIMFVADNPGHWMFHCHDLHHAASGMMTDVNYQDYKGSYRADRNKTSE